MSTRRSDRSPPYKRDSHRQNSPKKVRRSSGHKTYSSSSESDSSTDSGRAKSRKRSGEFRNNGGDYSRDDYYKKQRTYSPSSPYSEQRFDPNGGQFYKGRSPPDEYAYKPHPQDRYSQPPPMMQPGYPSHMYPSHPQARYNTIPPVHYSPHNADRYRDHQRTKHFDDSRSSSPSVRHTRDRNYYRDDKRQNEHHPEPKSDAKIHKEPAKEATPPPPPPPVTPTKQQTPINQQPSLPVTPIKNQLSTTKESPLQYERPPQSPMFHSPAAPSPITPMIFTSPNNNTSLMSPMNIQTPTSAMSVNTSALFSQPIAWIDPNDDDEMIEIRKSIESSQQEQQRSRELYELANMDMISMQYKTNDMTMEQHVVQVRLDALQRQIDRYSKVIDDYQTRQLAISNTITPPQTL
ncbi:hypothetical protein AKO1_001600 [Acrasis kona]|uniref:Uncharacterized protein n=1 Tax=Acrasis kona TaxID=1008807 RepID=A0AAW2ZA71_9EUKA